MQSPTCLKRLKATSIANFFKTFVKHSSGYPKHVGTPCGSQISNLNWVMTYFDSKRINDILLGQLAFRLHVSRMVTELMDDGARGVVILVDGRGLGLGGEVSFGFQVVLQLVNDWSRGAEVAILASHLRGLFERSFGFQMVLEGSHNVATRSRQGFVLDLGLGLVGQGVCGQT